MKRMFHIFLWSIISSILNEKIILYFSFPSTRVGYCFSSSKFFFLQKSSFHGDIQRGYFFLPLLCTSIFHLKSTYYIACLIILFVFFSIKLRTEILKRGLADRSTAVAKECLRMMNDDWLEKCCNGDPTVLLKYLDVETYESVGELVIANLLKAGSIKLQDGQTIRKFFISDGDSAEGRILI